MLFTFSSWPNEFSIPAEHFVGNSGFFPVNCCSVRVLRQLLAIRIFRHEPVSAWRVRCTIQHRVRLVQFYFNMSLLENVAGNFNANFQQNQFQVNNVSCDFYLQGISKGKVCKINRHTLEEISKISLKQLRMLTTVCSAGLLNAFGREGNICSICHSTGKFLLDFLKVITAIVCLISSSAITPLEKRHTTQRWRSVKIVQSVYKHST